MQGSPGPFAEISNILFKIKNSLESISELVTQINKFLVELNLKFTCTYRVG